MRWLAVILALWVGCAAAPAQAQPVTAILEPADLVELRPLVSGRLLEISVKEGVAVSAGTVLATLDADQQSQRVAVAEAVAHATGQTLRADAQLTQAKEVLARVIAARDRGAAQPWEVTQAEQTVRLAEADRQIAQDLQDQAEAQLALELAVLSDFTLRAPFAGVVLEHGVEPGESVDPSSVILSFARLDTLEATAFVPVTWIEDVILGQTLQAEVDGTARRPADVIVQTIDPRIDPASQTVRVRFALDNTDGLFRPGATLILNAP